MYHPSPIDMGRGMTQGIPEIPEIPAQIRRAAEEDGRLAVFVGAGVSRLLGFPSWEEWAGAALKKLAEKIKNDYWCESVRTRFKDPRQILSFCLHGPSGEGLSREELAGLLVPTGTGRARDVPDVTSSLQSLNTAYLTTNYDRSLCEGISRPRVVTTGADTALGSQVRILAYDAEADLNEGNLRAGHVLHIHGSVSDIDRMVVTKADYARRYAPDSPLAKLLIRVFREWTVLFVGYGLEEVEVLDFLFRRKQEINTDEQSRHFMLYPLYGEDLHLCDALQDYFSEVAVEMIPFSISRLGYRQLAFVLDAWAKQVKARDKSVVADIRTVQLAFT